MTIRHDSKQQRGLSRKAKRTRKHKPRLTFFASFSCLISSSADSFRFSFASPPPRLAAAAEFEDFNSMLLPNGHHTKRTAHSTESTQQIGEKMHRYEGSKRGREEAREGRT